jgi:hypothetical protein
MRILAIDPGPEVSGVVWYNTENRTIASAFSVANHIANARSACDILAFEMIASYGMAVGESVFETLLWAGRFCEIFGWENSRKIYRKEVTRFLCGSSQANDSNVRQAIIDRFPATGGGKTPQIGIKDKPGPLYGVSKHAWSALGVALTAAGMAAFANGEGWA